MVPTPNESGSFSPRCLSPVLEVGVRDRCIHAFATTCPDTEQFLVFPQDFHSRDLTAALVKLDELAAGAAFLLGHNLGRCVTSGDGLRINNVVNGMPVAIVEHKNPQDRDASERGVTQLWRYEKETPELMTAPQLFNVTHLIDYWYGVTWNISRRFMARWKEQSEESYRFAVQSFFEPAGFLRTLWDWILFYIEDGETRKSVLRQHQRRAVDHIVERCSEPVKRRLRTALYRPLLGLAQDERRCIVELVLANLPDIGADADA